MKRNVMAFRMVLDRSSAPMESWLSALGTTDSFRYSGAKWERIATAGPEWIAGALVADRGRSPFIRLDQGTRTIQLDHLREQQTRGGISPFVISRTWGLGLVVAGRSGCITWAPFRNAMRHVVYEMVRDMRATASKKEAASLRQGTADLRLIGPLPTFEQQLDEMDEVHEVTVEYIYPTESGGPLDQKASRYQARWVIDKQNRSGERLQTVVDAIKDQFSDDNARRGVVVGANGRRIVFDPTSEAFERILAVETIDDSDYFSGWTATMPLADLPKLPVIEHLKDVMSRNMHIAAAMREEP